MLAQTRQPTLEQLADWLVQSRSDRAALALVERVDADCFTELIARSTLSGRLDRELFELLGAAFDAHVPVRAMRAQAREIAALPEARPA